MKLIDTLVCTTALLCAASFHAEAADPAPVRPFLVAQNDASMRMPHHADLLALTNGPGERGARAAAARGPQELRRYISRTRMIYALQYADFAPQ